ncbi:MAG: GHMP kinase [Clostridia bacterium]|nr:GHMP kinase [Clostridia bacterium]
MQNLQEVFEYRFPQEKEVLTAFCPYRVCPIGAHSDHQYGLVTGLAISEGVHIMYTPTENGEMVLHSMNIFGDHTFNVKNVGQPKKNWADYVRGAVMSLRRKHEVTVGVRAVVNGTMPIGGLSSSAALTIAFLSALCRVNSIKLNAQEIIEHALWTENSYIGVKCGKLDMSCEVLARKDKLLYLDTKDDSYELMPKRSRMKPYEIAIFFSGLERSLMASSAFNSRVDEMKSAAFAMKTYAGMEGGTFADSRLRDVPREVFEQYKDRLPDAWCRRATHFYDEYDRVKAGAVAWKNGDIEEYGRLVFESGHSSIYNYETGSPELIKLYEIMRETEGIYGGRFSGAGFKGCCMAIIDPRYRESITAHVTEEYLKAFPNLKGKFSAHICVSADGCKFE